MSKQPTGMGTRIAARGAAAVVALVAGAASFEHIASVAHGAGERTWVAQSLPFAIDGLIVVGVAALLEDQRQQRTGRLSARVAVLVGVVATLAANVASAEPTATARLVALTAPVSFLLSVEVLTRTGRKLSTPDDTTTGQPTTAGQAGEGQSTPEPALAARSRPARGSSTTRRPNAAQRVAKAVEQTPTATAAQIAARLKVSERTVQRYWPTPAPDTVSPPVDTAAPVEVSRSNGRAPVPPDAFVHAREARR